jgi:hypothetical protein
MAPRLPPASVRLFDLPGLAVAAVRLFVLLAFPLALAGCGPRLLQMRATLADAPVCCKRVDQIAYAPLPPGDSRTLSIGPPAFRFDGGKSYFSAWALPPLQAPARLLVESYLQVVAISMSEEERYLFAPQLLLLDERFATVAQVPLRARRLMYVPFTEFATTGGLGWKLALSVDVEAGSGVRYAIVHTTDALLAGDTPMDAPIVRANDLRVAHAPQGRLRVSLSPVADLLDRVVIDPRSPGSLTFVSYARAPAPGSGMPRGEVTVDPAPPAETLPWMRFREESTTRLSGLVLKNDYPDVDLRAALLELLIRFPGTPIGITWNGGFAITAGDYREAETRLSRFREDPARHERERPTDRAGDRLHPLNHLRPLLGW